MSFPELLSIVWVMFRGNGGFLSERYIFLIFVLVQISYAHKCLWSVVKPEISTRVSLRKPHTETHVSVSICLCCSMSSFVFLNIYSENHGGSGKFRIRSAIVSFRPVVPPAPRPRRSNTLGGGLVRRGDCRERQRKHGVVLESSP